MGNISIGAKTVLDNCVICNNNEIAKNVTAKAGMILAEGCYIGQLTNVEKDVIIWPNKVIEDASIVNNNVILGSRYKNSIFENGRVMGQSNVELSCEMVTKLAEALGAQLPIGSTVIVSRDYQKSSRMLKRAFLGGLLSAGIDVIDYRDIPTAVLRYNLAHNDSYIGGVYFNQKIDDPTSTVITFYNDEALRINSNVAKKIEKAFFKETFRRVEYSKIGQIHESDHEKEYFIYKQAIANTFEKQQFRCADCRIGVDMMHGMALDVFPDILNELGVDNLIFNAHQDSARLSAINTLKKQSENDLSAVIKALHLDAGFMIYPYGQQLDIMCDEGQILGKQAALYTVLTLLNMDAKLTGEKKKVFLPTWAADIAFFEYLEIYRGKYSNFKAQELKQYDLIATGEGNFAFTEFSVYRDSMFATLKILELMVKHHVTLSELIASLPRFYYTTTNVKCSQALKGKMMRMFLKEAKGKKSSNLDGVKIWLDKNDWILMIPDQYSDSLNLYIQAENDEKGEAILATYTEKIEMWSKE